MSKLGFRGMLLPKIARSLDFEMSECNTFAMIYFIYSELVFKNMKFTEKDITINEMFSRSGKATEDMYLPLAKVKQH